MGKEELGRLVKDMESAYRQMVEAHEAPPFSLFSCGPAWNRFWRADKEIKKLFSPRRNDPYNIRVEIVGRVEKEKGGD